LKNYQHIATIRYIKKLPAFLGVFFLLLSGCENDIEKINAITNSSELPKVSGTDVEVIYSDSGKVQLKMLADELKQFTNSERPYMEFPKGIHVIFYDDSLNIETEIEANYAIYYNEEKLWEARGDVTLEHIIDGRKLNTEELYWNEDTRRIYSNSFSRIETPDGVFYGQEGFESNQKFTKWQLKRSRGIINYKEQENNEEQEPNP